MWSKFFIKNFLTISGYSFIYSELLEECAVSSNDVISLFTPNYSGGIVYIENLFPVNFDRCYVSLWNKYMICCDYFSFVTFGLLTEKTFVNELPFMKSPRFYIMHFLYGEIWDTKDFFEIYTWTLQYSF